MMFYAHKEALVIDDDGFPTGDTRRIMDFLEKAWWNAMKIKHPRVRFFAQKRYDMLCRYVGA